MVLYYPTSLITIIGLELVRHPSGANHNRPSNKSVWLICRWANHNLSLGFFWPWGPRLVDVSFAAAGCNVSVVWRMLTPETNDDWQVREGVMGVSQWPSNSWFNVPEAQRHLLVYLRVNWVLFWPKLEQAWFLSLVYNKDLSNKHCNPCTHTSLIHTGL